MVRDKDTVHGKNAKIGILANTPKNFVNGSAIDSTAWREIKQRVFIEYPWLVIQRWRARNEASLIDISKLSFQLGFGVAELWEPAECLLRYRCFRPHGHIVPSTLQKSQDCKYYTVGNHQTFFLPIRNLLQIMHRHRLHLDYLEHTTETCFMIKINCVRRILFALVATLSPSCG